MLIVVILSWWITSEQIKSQIKLKRQNESQKTDILGIILILHTHENQFLKSEAFGPVLLRYTTDLTLKILL